MCSRIRIFFVVIVAIKRVSENPNHLKFSFDTTGNIYFDMRFMVILIKIVYIRVSFFFLNKNVFHINFKHQFDVILKPTFSLRS